MMSKITWAMVIISLVIVNLIVIFYTAIPQYYSSVMGFVNVAVYILYLHLKGSDQ